MRFRLDPTSPSGLSVVADTVIQQRQSPGYITDNISGLLTAGTNVTITGNGTKASPFHVSSTGGGASTSPTVINTAGFDGTIYSNNLNNARDYQLPDATGVIALESYADQIGTNVENYVDTFFVLKSSITVSSTAPSSPSVNDLWVDTS